MTRTRSKENAALPQRWTWKHGAIYYIVPPDDKHLWDGKSWFKLGKNLSEAHKSFAERIEVHSGKIITVQDLLYKFEFEYITTLSRSTREYYLTALPILRAIFTTHANLVTALEPHHAYQMMNAVEQKYSVKKARQCFECLSSAYSQGVKWGAVRSNPFLGQVKKSKGEVESAKEIPDSELIAFAGILQRKWQLYISLKLHTKGRRKGELLRLKRSDLIDSGIRFTNNKRKDDQFIVAWTTELHEIVDELIKIQAPRVGDCELFYTNKFKSYITDDGRTAAFNSMWQRAMGKAVSKGLCNPFKEHWLRAKAVENFNLDSAAEALRHTDKKTTAAHYRPLLEKI